MRQSASASPLPSAAAPQDRHRCSGGLLRCWLQHRQLLGGQDQRHYIRLVSSWGSCCGLGLGLGQLHRQTAAGLGLGHLCRACLQVGWHFDWYAVLCFVVCQQTRAAVEGRRRIQFLGCWLCCGTSPTWLRACQSCSSSCQHSACALAPVPMCPSPAMAAATSAMALECTPTWLPTAWASNRARCRRTGNSTSQTPAPAPENASSSGEPVRWVLLPTRHTEAGVFPAVLGCTHAFVGPVGWHQALRLPDPTVLSLPARAATHALFRLLPHRRPSEGPVQCLVDEKLGWPGHQPHFLPGVQHTCSRQPAPTRLTQY